MNFNQSRSGFFTSSRRMLTAWALLMPGNAALAAAESGPMPPTGVIAILRSAIVRLSQTLEPIVAAAPSIPAELGRAWEALGLDPSTPLVPGLFTTLIILVLMAGAARVGRHLAQAWLRPNFARSPATAVARRFLVDLASVLALALIAYIGVEFVARGPGLVSELLRHVIDLGLILALALIVPLALFRPGEPALRLIDSSESQIERARPFAVAGMLIGIAFPVTIPVWLKAGMDWKAAQALAVLIGLGVAILGFEAARRYFQAAPNTMRIEARLAGIAAAFWLAWSYGVVTLDFPFYFLMTRLGAVLTVGFLLDRLFQHSMRVTANAQMAASTPELPPVADAEIDGEGPAAEQPPTMRTGRFWADYGRALQRTMRFFTIAAALLVFASWFGEAFPLLAERKRFASILESLDAALITLGIGYAIFEALSAWTKARYSSSHRVQKPGQEEGEAAPASRLATIMPIVQGLIGVVVLGVSALSALSRIGVDITPILAGAGILGLAISFGSQSLVRDVVAGIFYMVDDAFRLGEYIEAGRLKGSVERISMRSVQLRHHNGYLHTVPFGQLGSITNFSRDWMTMKFNLRLARTIDIDRVRKIVKKIGAEMLEDPEFAKEIILPLKMQGIADIVENAYVARFKLTVRPGKPTFVQREAIKRMIRAFDEQGIPFAQNAVVVHSNSERDDPDDAAAAETALRQQAASAARAKEAP